MAPFATNHDLALLSFPLAQMRTERPCRSVLDPRRSWIVYQTGESQFACRPSTTSHNNKTQGPGGLSQSKAYRDTAFWGKDKMTYEELTSAWDAFNRSEELTAYYFTQSEAVDRVFEQVFQNVRVDCEDLDGLKPRRESATPGECVDCCCRSGVCKANRPPGVECVASASAETHGERHIDQLTTSLSTSSRNNFNPCISTNAFDQAPYSIQDLSQR